MKQSPFTYIIISLIMVLTLGTTLMMMSSFVFKPNLEKFNPPLIKTKRNKTTLCLSPQYKLNAWYSIECVVGFCSEFNPDEEHHDKTNYYEFYDNPTKENKQAYSNDDLMLVVDTAREIAMTKRPIWASYLFHQNLGDKKITLQDDTLIQDVKSFPVYLANTSENKIANIETQDGSLIMVTEAKDSSGKWNALEYWSHSWCGNSYFSLDIKPKHFAFTRGIKCSGDYYTTCRLKLFIGSDSLFSNEFKMTINKNQFKMPKEKTHK